MTKLLNHTPEGVSEREALVINPAKTCQPVGAMYASLGLHGCLPHSHGSQGCCSYHRSVLTKHYKEPVMAATSSFTEGSSVFGGQANLVQGLGTIFELYDPDVVAVHTTCLSETIGDDIPQIVSKALEEDKIPAGKKVIHANTPSYIGSHVTGFSSMTRAMAEYLAASSGKRGDHVNVIPGWTEPADMREIKRIIGLMGIPFVMFPDTSGVMDGPMTGKFRMYPKGGTTLADMARTADAKATLALGEYASSAAAKYLDSKFKVPCSILDLPIGLAATDRFVDAARRIAGKPVPDALVAERGRLLDLMIDMGQYTHGKRVAIAGDPDQLVALTEFLLALGMKPVYIVTGTPGKRFEAQIAQVMAESGIEYECRSSGDLFRLHQSIKREKADLLIGNTYCKYIARDEDIPFVRFGFPILDRTRHQHFPTAGYSGAIGLLDGILSALLDRTDRDAPNESFELTL
jgi:nitrogenase molybdenum-iron protein beta chain